MTEEESEEEFEEPDEPKDSVNLEEKDKDKN